MPNCSNVWWISSFHPKQSLDYCLIKFSEEYCDKAVKIKFSTSLKKVLDIHN